jgi:hypothetical protein
MNIEPSGLGVQRYVDSPIFIDIVLGLFGFALGFGAWLQYTVPDRNLLVVGGLAIGALLCLVSIFAQKRRTFTFDSTTRKLSWTSGGFRQHTGGTVDFNDVRITLDPSIGQTYTSYRVMINTPQGSWPLTTGYDANDKKVQAKATQLRTLMGQSSETLIDDSVTELKKQGNLISAATILGRQRGIATAQAFSDLTQA